MILITLLVILSGCSPLSNSTNEEKNNQEIESKALEGSVKVGCVSLNNGTPQDLITLKGIGQKKADAIVAFRKEHGRFKTVEDIQDIKGIGPKFIEKNLDMLCL